MGRGRGEGCTGVRVYGNTRVYSHLSYYSYYFDIANWMVDGMEVFLMNS